MAKKNIAKKITAIAVGVALSAMSFRSVFAYDVGYSDDPCKRCRDTSVWVKEEFKNVSTTGVERKCIHHTYGTDLQMENHYAIEYECRECLFGWSGDRYTYYWECHGYEAPGYN